MNNIGKVIGSDGAFLLEVKQSGGESFREDRETTK